MAVFCGNFLLTKECIPQITHTEWWFYTVESKYSKQPAAHLCTICRTKLVGSMDEECKIFKAKKCNKENEFIKKRSHISIYGYSCKPVYRKAYWVPDFFTFFYILFVWIASKKKKEKKKQEKLFYLQARKEKRKRDKKQEELILSAQRNSKYFILLYQEDGGGWVGECRAVIKKRQHRTGVVVRVERLEHLL